MYFHTGMLRVSVMSHIVSCKTGLLIFLRVEGINSVVVGTRNRRLQRLTGDGRSDPGRVNYTVSGTNAQFLPKLFLTPIRIRA